MKNFILFIVALLVVGGLYRGWNTGQWNVYFNSGDQQRVMTDPVYAVIRFRAAIHDRSFDMVTFAKTYDQADCKHVSDELVNTMRSDQDAAGVTIWQLVSSECKSTLDARNAKLFDNVPTFVNYLSAAAGNASEREVRQIVWGVTAEEGELVCREAPRIQARWKGRVTCIHALASQ